MDIAEHLFNITKLVFLKSTLITLYRRFFLSDLYLSGLVKLLAQLNLLFLQSAPASPEVPEYGFGDVNIIFFHLTNVKMCRYSLLRRQKQNARHLFGRFRASAFIKSIKKSKSLEAKTTFVTTDNTIDH